MWRTDLPHFFFSEAKYTLCFKKFSLLVFTIAKSYGDQFLQSISIASYAEDCISYNRFRLSVRHSPVSRQNDSTYDRGVFTAG